MDGMREEFYTPDFKFYCKKGGVEEKSLCGTFLKSLSSAQDEFICAANDSLLGYCKQDNVAAFVHGNDIFHPYGHIFAGKDLNETDGSVEDLFVRCGTGQKFTFECRLKIRKANLVPGGDVETHKFSEWTLGCPAGSSKRFNQSVLQPPNSITAPTWRQLVCEGVTSSKSKFVKLMAHIFHAGRLRRICLCQNVAFNRRRMLPSICVLFVSACFTFFYKF